MTISRLFISLLFTTLFSFCFGQKEIVMTKQDGVYMIPCLINGVKRSLVFDTGASTVTISIKLAEQLYRSGKLKDADIKGFGKSQTASGHIVDNMAIILRDVEISGFHLKNIDAVIIKGQNVPLLLGLSAIQKLGKVTLSGNKLIIDGNLLDNSQISRFRAEIELLINDDKYNEALVLLKKIESRDAIEEIDAYNLALCYTYSHDFNRALMYCQHWMGSYEGTSSSHETEICYFMGLAYMGLKSYYEADNWFANAIRKIRVDAVDQTSREDAYTLSFYYNQKAVNYLQANNYEYCVEAFDIATQYRMRFLGKTIDDLCGGMVKDERIGIMLESISKIYAVFLHDEKKAERYGILAALCGNQEAIDACDYLKLDYSPRIK